MPDAVAVLVPPRRLSLRFKGLPRVGTSARRLLRRLLLGSDGTFVCRRGDERALDRSPRAACSFGETYSLWTVGRARRRSCLYRRWRLDSAIFQAVMIGPTGLRARVSVLRGRAGTSICGQSND
jgi:hypothetical protein